MSPVLLTQKQIKVDQHELPKLLRVERFFQIYRSEQNGWVHKTDGLSPTIMVGCHSGVAPMIIEYEER